MNVCEAIVNVPERDVVLLLAATEYPTERLPVPELPLVTEIKLALPVAVELQLLAVDVTLTVPVVAADPTETDVGFNVKVQTVNAV